MVETSEATDIPEIINFVNTNNLNEVKKLLLTGHKVDEVDSNGMTPLQHASYKGQYDMCKLLIENVSYILKSLI